MMRYRWIVLLLVLAAGCREEDGPLGGTGTGTLVVQSDPARGRITLNGRQTNRFTPDTIRNISGLQQVEVDIDSSGVPYGYAAQVVVTGSEPVVLNGPLMARCETQVSTCPDDYYRMHNAGSTRFSTNALGALFLQEGEGAGLYWPATSSNAYLSTGMPVLAARIGTQPVSLGVYDTEFLAGRPAPQTRTVAGGFEVTQTTWVVPTPSLAPLAVVRGVSVRERVVASTGSDGVLLVELTFRNITNETLYRILDPYLGATGITLADAYIGLALDPDIGVADDDWLSYDASLESVFAYDADFSEGSFTTQQSSPGLVGLRVLRAPTGTSVVLNGWANTTQGSLDWRAGTQSQFTGYAMLSGGAGGYEPDHPGSTIGHLPPTAGDARITASVGPLQLAPGDSATVVLAVVLAPPAAATFASGQVMQPGSPDDTARPLYAVAANLRSRLEAAEALLPLLEQ